LTIAVKICGLTTAETVSAAVDAGARYVGFVHFPKSPRHVEPHEIQQLAGAVTDGVCKVALTVDADDATLDTLLAVAPIDMIQLHGHESPERVAEVRQRTGLPVMKAIGVADAADLDQIPSYARVSDQILIDAKPPKNSAIPGGNGLSFDWRLIEGRRWALPWMLAGGLDAHTVADGVSLTGATQVDVSSGVEAERGLKNPNLIREFIAAAQI